MININNVDFSNKEEAGQLAKSLDNFKNYAEYKGQYLNNNDITKLMYLASLKVNHDRLEIVKLIKYLHENNNIISKEEMETQLKYLQNEIDKYNENLEFLKSIQP